MPYTVMDWLWENAEVKIRIPIRDGEWLELWVKVATIQDNSTTYWRWQERVGADPAGQVIEIAREAGGDG